MLERAFSIRTAKWENSAELPALWRPFPSTPPKKVTKSKFLYEINTVKNIRSVILDESPIN